MKEGPVENGIRVIELSSWRDMIGLVDSHFSKAPAYLYRGQANYEWPLTSSLDRLRKSYPKRKNLTDGGVPEYFGSPPLTVDQQLDAFKRAIRGKRGQNPKDLDEDELWAIGQHHGLATPLLDMARSPFAALYFAFKEEHIVIDDRVAEPEFRGVYALSSSTILDPPKTPAGIQPKLVSPDSHDNHRMVGQTGLFVKLPEDKGLDVCVRLCFDGESRYATLTKISIPNRERHECLIALNKMNINEMTLFPDMDGAARHVNSLWQPGHEDSIAYV